MYQVKLTLRSQMVPSERRANTKRRRTVASMDKSTGRPAPGVIEQIRCVHDPLQASAAPRSRSRLHLETVDNWSKNRTQPPASFRMPHIKMLKNPANRWFSVCLSTAPATGRATYVTRRFWCRRRPDCTCGNSEIEHTLGALVRAFSDPGQCFARKEAASQGRWVSGQWHAVVASAAPPLAQRTARG